MNEQFDKKSILEMSMGVILERVDYEMGRVLDNIIDPNTKATAKRKITGEPRIDTQLGPKDHHSAEHSQKYLGAYRAYYYQPLYHESARHRRDGCG